MTKRISLIFILSAVMAAAFPLEAISAAGQPARQRSGVSFADVVAKEVEGVFERLKASGDYKVAEGSLEEVFDRVIAYAPHTDRESFRQASLALRLVRQLAEVDAAKRRPLLEFLLENPRLAGLLAFSVKPEHQKPAEVYALLKRLREQRGHLLETHANLATAICIVHDRPLSHRINENRAHAPDPLAIFDYFIASESNMHLGLRNMPVELLIYVVDTTASIEDMKWAARRYRGDAEVGRRFFDIKYDYNHLRRGTTKRVTEVGFNLPNILEHGGVCADQAYFAVHVGKSIGVPTVYVSGASAEVSHAWVGFLQAAGRRAWWNFDLGRYEAYQRVRGSSMDPQTRQRIPDNHIGILAELINTSEAERQQAAAIVDAATRLRDLASRKQGLGRDLAPLGERSPKEPVRKADVASQLALIEAGLRINHGHAPGWFMIRDMAAANELSLQQKREWSTVLHRLCGEHYPDFHLAILKPMIESVSDTRAQDRMWVEAGRLFPGRDDLAAELLMGRAAMWEKAGGRDGEQRAGQCYEEIINRFANSGPFILTALNRAEHILRRNNRADLVAVLYESAWEQIARPRDMAAPYIRQSNWVRVGNELAKKQEEAGNAQRAATVRAALPGE